MKTLKITAFLLATIISMNSCKPDEPEDPPIPNEEELITTLRLTMTPAAGGDDIVFEFKDLDGDGSGAPEYILDTLAANEIYSLAVTFLNEAESPAEDITQEVAEEALEHQVFFESTVPDLTFTYGDMDSGGNPIGLLNTVQSGIAGDGLVKVTLIHEPMKTADGVSGGDITNAGGDADIEVDFDFVVQ